MRIRDFGVGFCLCLDKRKNQWNKTIKPFEYRGLEVFKFICGDGSDPELEYDHIDIKANPPILQGSTQYGTWHKPAAFNAWLCHREILMTFYYYFKCYDRLLILEDDAIIENDFDEILPQIPDFEFEFLYLGGYASPTQLARTKISDRLYKTNGTAGWHAVVISRRIIPEILSWPPLGPMDWMSQQTHPYGKAYMVLPEICRQQSGFSFIENSHLEKPGRNVGL